MPKKRITTKKASKAKRGDSPHRLGAIFIQLPGDSAEPPPTFLEDFPDHARLIGSIIAEWSHIEHKLALLLSFHMGANWKIIRPMLYAIESPSARIEAIRAAFMKLLVGDVPRQEAMNSLIDRTRALLTQRNKYAHGLYGFTPNGNLAIVAMGKGTEHELPLHDLTHQFDEMKKLSHLIGQMLGFETRQAQLAKLVASAARQRTESEKTDPQTPP